MPHSIRTAAVLGAGAMGAQLAAHLANAGLPVLLLDVSDQAARQGLDRAAAVRPEAFFTAAFRSRVTTGSFEDLAGLAACDWIIEAIVEDLGAKRALLGHVDTHQNRGAIVSSNTSGLSVTAMAENRSEGFRRHWLGTHFFNPPRYRHLVEMIPTSDTDPSVTAVLGEFIDRRLGAGVVAARDTPGFIGNRLGLFGAARVLEVLAAGQYSIEEIDAVTGPVIGRPKSATLRTADIAGLDILARVAGDLAQRLPDGDRFLLPPFVDRLLERGWLGEKSGQGFYKKVGRGDDSKILTLDLAAFEYRDRAVVTLPALDRAKAIADMGQRIRVLFLDQGRVGALLRDTLGATLLYAASVAPAIAESIDDIDRVMQWGYGWELGPFDTWDAIGIRAVLEACGVTTPPPLVQQVLDAGRDRFRDAPTPPARPDLLILQTAKRQSHLVKTNGGASLVDLGDGVLCLEFHSKMNTLGGDAIAMIDAGVTEATTRFAALIIGNDAEHFSAGADLMLLLLEAREGNWDEIDRMVRTFQSAMMALKTSSVPVVVAPAGLALGGGCEVCLHADRVQAAAETYMGLVEAGVGLVPAGGGTKEMLLRAIDRAHGIDPEPHVQRAFEQIGFAAVSTSGAEARRLGYLRDVDEITVNRARLLADAKAVALTRARTYVPPLRRMAVPVGGAATFATLSLGVHLAWRAGRLTDHDARIGRALARILAGGDVPHATTVTEDHLLDLEREAFLSLMGESLTLARIAHTLKTGKTLRN
jgi:3-hydroxyacyl-CoA dehydrogenase